MMNLLIELQQKWAHHTPYIYIKVIYTRMMMLGKESSVDVLIVQQWRNMTESWCKWAKGVYAQVSSVQVHGSVSHILMT